MHGFLTIFSADDKLLVSNSFYERRHEKMKTILASAKLVFGAPPEGEM